MLPSYVFHVLVGSMQSIKRKSYRNTASRTENTKLRVLYAKRMKTSRFTRSLTTEFYVAFVKFKLVNYRSRITNESHLINVNIHYFRLNLRHLLFSAKIHIQAKSGRSLFSPVIWCLMGKFNITLPVMKGSFIYINAMFDFVWNFRGIFSFFNVR